MKTASLLLITIIFFSFLPHQGALLHAQTPILPGQTQTITAERDTLMVVKYSEMKEAIKASKHLEIADTMIILLEEKTERLKQIINEKDSIIALNREGYIHYRDLWETTDLELEEAQIRIEELKRSRLKTGIMSGLLTGVLTVAIIGIANGL